MHEPRPTLAAPPDPKLPASLLPPGSNAVVFGRKGAGKTSLARWSLARHSRCLIVDPHREYSDLAVEIDSLDALPEYFERSEGRWRIAYHNDHLNDDFPTLCNVMYGVGDCHFLVDEADWFCTPLAIPYEFDRLVKYGRHRRITLCCLSRAPSEVHRNITRNAYECFAFSLQEPRDLEYLRAYCGEEFTGQLPGLPVLEGRRVSLADRTEPILAFRLTPGAGGGTLTPIGNGARRGGVIGPSRRRALPSAPDDDGPDEPGEGEPE
jgi:hypothetical protein